MSYRRYDIKCPYDGALLRLSYRATDGYSYHVCRCCGKSYAGQWQSWDDAPGEVFAPDPRKFTIFRQVPGNWEVIAPAGWHPRAWHFNTHAAAIASMAVWG